MDDVSVALMPDAGREPARIQARFSAAAQQRLVDLVSAIGAGALTDGQLRAGADLLDRYIAKMRAMAEAAGVELDSALPDNGDRSPDDLGPYILGRVVHGATSGTLTVGWARAGLEVLRGALAVDAPAAHVDSSDAWLEHSARVFEARERWLDSGDPNDKQDFEQLFDEYSSRFDCNTCERGGQLCRCTFDSAHNSQTERIASSMTTRKSADYEAGRRFSEQRRDELETRDLPLPLHRQPLSTVVQAAVSKFDAADVERQRQRAAAEASRERAHYREQFRLLENGNDTSHLDAGDDAEERVCPDCEQKFTGKACSCKGSGAFGRAKGTRSLPAGGGVPPWKQPLLVSSERSVRLPSRAMRFEDDEVA